MKLLRKDVLRWIKTLKSGQYRKGKGYLVDKTGTKFCCLGVWADMHGCSWREDDWKQLIPIPKGRVNVKHNSTAYLHDPKLVRGLDMDKMQRPLASLNDKERTFGKVIEYIEKEILPLAK